MSAIDYLTLKLKCSICGEKFESHDQTKIIDTEYRESIYISLGSEISMDVDEDLPMGGFYVGLFEPIPDGVIRIVDFVSCCHCEFGYNWLMLEFENQNRLSNAFIFEPIIEKLECAHFISDEYFIAGETIGKGINDEIINYLIEKSFDYYKSRNMKWCTPLGVKDDAIDYLKTTDKIV